VLIFVDSHLQGMFYRTARLLELGLKPAYVFDGKPPVLKTVEVCFPVSVSRESIG